MKITKSLPLWLACAVSTSVAAQSTLEPVVVSATRSVQSEVTTPSSITIITREEIEESHAQHVVQILRGRAGLQVQELYGNGSDAAISMRGFGSTPGANTLVLVDGRRLNNTDLGGPDLNSVALKDVERIEIIQGSAGVLFGDQAVGGVINIITRRASELTGDLTVGAGSFGRQFVRGSVANRLANGFGFRVSGETLDNDNYRDHNEQEYRNLSAYADYELANGTVYAEIQRSDEELQLPDALSEAQVNSDPTQSTGVDSSDDTSDVRRLGTRLVLGENLQFEGELSDRDSTTEGSFFASPFEQNRQHQEFTPRLIMTLPMAAGEALITAGIDLTRTDYDITSAFGATEAQQETQGLYAQAVMPLTAADSLTLGIRHASVENDIEDSLAFPTGTDINDDVTVWELGYSHNFDSGRRVYARVDRNFRFAKIDESTFTEPTVTALDTQMGTSVELGYERDALGYEYKVVLWQLDIEDEIDFDANADGPFGPGSGANVNLDDTLRRGLILEGAYRPTREWKVSAEYAYTSAKFKSGSFDGNTVPMVAANTLRLALTHYWDAHWQFFGEADYTGKRYLQSDYDNSADQMDSRVVLNASAGYLRGNWHASIRINNLTDESYEDFATLGFAGPALYPAPDRNGVIEVGYRW